MKSKPCTKHKQAYPKIDLPEMDNIEGIRECSKCRWYYK